MIKTPLSTVIGGAFWTPNCTILGGTSKTFDQLIKSLFSNNEQGFAYDPNDLTTMFQDANGTVPVTGAGQPVGLWLDKSGRNNHAFQTTSAARPILQFTPILGLNILPNGNFNAGMGKWVSLNTSAFSVVAGRAYHNASGGSGSAVLASEPIFIQGKTYKVSYSYEVLQGAFYCGGSYQSTVGGRSITGKERGSFTITVSDARDLRVSFRPENSQNIAEFYIDDVTVQEITGYSNKYMVDYDSIDDKLITTLSAQLTGCTVIRSVPNVGTQILTNQTIPATYEDNKDHCGLIVINRALTPSETSAIAAEFNKRAGV